MSARPRHLQTRRSRTLIGTINSYRQVLYQYILQPQAQLAIIARQVVPPISSSHMLSSSNINSLHTHTTPNITLLNTPILLRWKPPQNYMSLDRVLVPGRPGLRSSNLPLFHLISIQVKPFIMRTLLRVLSLSTRLTSSVIWPARIHRNTQQNRLLLVGLSRQKCRSGPTSLSNLCTACRTGNTLKVICLRIFIILFQAQLLNNTQTMKYLRLDHYHR